MPMIRRCPHCGDDLMAAEEVCSFCGRPAPRPGPIARAGAALEEYSISAALFVVLYLIGLDIALKVVDTVAPGAAAAVWSRPWAERGLRIAIALAFPAALEWERRGAQRRENRERAKAREKAKEGNRDRG